MTIVKNFDEYSEFNLFLGKSKIKPEDQIGVFYYLKQYEVIQTEIFDKNKAIRKEPPFYDENELQIASVIPVEYYIRIKDKLKSLT